MIQASPQTRNRSRRPRRPIDRSGVALFKRRTRETTTSPADARLHRVQLRCNSENKDCEANRPDDMMRAFYMDDPTMSTWLSRRTVDHPASPSYAAKRTLTSCCARSRQHHHIRRHRRRSRRHDHIRKHRREGLVGARRTHRPMPGRPTSMPERRRRDRHAATKPKQAGTNLALGLP